MPPHTHLAVVTPLNQENAENEAVEASVDLQATDV